MLIRAVTLTIGARVLSALLSFGVFAQVAALLPPASAARVLFFSFVFGFCLATLRTFHLIAAGVVGGEPRTRKLRRMRGAAQTLRRFMFWAGPAVLALLLGQGVGWPVAAAGAALVVLCGQDLDLARSALGRYPVLPWLTAAGGLLALLLLTLRPASEATCAMAFVVQWVPAAVFQLAYGGRLLPRLKRESGRSSPWYRRLGDTTGLFLTAVFDGAVLNAPFLVVVPLAAAAAVDLALGNRLFVASLALFSLIASWVISGDIHRMAARASLRPATTFVLLQLGVCFVTGTVYAFVYQAIAHKPVGPAAFIVFMLTSLAYVIHSAGLRYLAPRLPVRAGVIAYGGALAAFYAVLLWHHHGGVADLRVIVCAVTLTLMAPPLMMWVLLRRILPGP